MDKKHPLAIFGNKLFELRRVAGLSQEDLAWRAGIDISTYGYIERGERNTTFLVIAKIAVVLEVEMSELLPSLPELQLTDDW